MWAMQYAQQQQLPFFMDIILSFTKEMLKAKNTTLYGVTKYVELVYNVPLDFYLTLISIWLIRL